MKKPQKGKLKVSPCGERDRLWRAFLAAGKEWNLQQDKMARELRRDGKINPDVKKIQAIQERIASSHRLFAKHIEKHGCSSVMAGTTQLEKKSIRKRK
jgi:hypothetical protein